MWNCSACAMQPTNLPPVGVYVRDASSMSQKSHLHTGSRAQDLFPQVVYGIQS